MPVQEVESPPAGVRQAAPGKYLEFRRVQELVEHLRASEVDRAHLDEVVRHDATNHDSIGSVSVYAVASQDLGTHVAIWGQLVGRELDVFLEGRAEMEAFRTKVRDRVQLIRTLLEGQGLQVLPGRWSHQPPRYL